MDFQELGGISVKSVKKTAPVVPKHRFTVPPVNNRSPNTLLG